MEDPSTLKWTIITAVAAFNIIVWITVAAVYARTRARLARKTAQGSKQQSRSTTPGEASLVQILQEIAEKHIETQSGTAYSEHSVRKLQPEEVASVTQLIDAVRRDKQPHSARETSRPAKPASAAKQPENAENYVESSDSEPFDLRQAVIISEILKSKFDE